VPDVEHNRAAPESNSRPNRDNFLSLYLSFPHTGESMPAYVVVQITVNDPDTYSRYKDLAPPAIAAYRGRYLLRGGTVKTLEGTWDPGRFVILEFPDGESAQAWWDSPEYAEAKALRQSCAHTEMILVEGPSFDPRTQKEPS
jgi:uncharacterized protein (DUF1330 family)